MRCCSGRHEWIDPISAERCCRPGWSQQLRFGASDRIPGDVDDGTVVVSGAGGMMFVWHFESEKVMEHIGRVDG